MSMNLQGNTMFILNNKPRGDWQIYKKTIESIASKRVLTSQNLKRQGLVQGGNNRAEMADAIESEE
jgi:hypothetical protein